MNFCRDLVCAISIFLGVFLTLTNIDIATKLVSIESIESIERIASNDEVLPHSPSSLAIVETQQHSSVPLEWNVCFHDSIYKGNVSCIECAPIIVEKYKLVFFTSAKVGCTVWKQLFRRIMGFDDWQMITNDAILPHSPKYNGLKYLYHYSIDEATYMMTSSQWTRALFVRDPKERLLSAYLDKGHPNNGRYVKRFCCSRHDTACKHRVQEDVATLNGFIINVTQGCWDNHWNLQARRMEQKYWAYIDFVGHLESATEDAESLLRRLGAWEEYGATGWGPQGNSSIFATNQSPHTTKAKNLLQMYYTPELENIVDWQLYKQDYEHQVLQLQRNGINWSAHEEGSYTFDSWNTHRITTARGDLFTGIIADNDPIYKGAIHCWDCSPVVIEKHKLIFFTIAKVGCTVFKQLFRRIMGHDDYATVELDGRVPQNPKTNGLIYLHHYSPDEVKDFLTSPNWTRAMFVRDPKERLLSAYLDKGLKADGAFVKEKCCEMDNAPPHCRQHVNQKLKTLDGFVDIVKWCPNPHWSSQSSRIWGRHWLFINFVGHLETVAQDTRELLLHLGLWELYGASGWGESGEDSIFGSNHAKHATGANEKLFDYYNPDLERKVEKLFATDYAHTILNFTMPRLTSM